MKFHVNIKPVGLTFEPYIKSLYEWSGLTGEPNVP